MMSPEEAGERILEGEPWQTCPCPKHSLTHASRCMLCDDWKTILDPRYEEACKAVGRPIPTREDMDAGLIPLAKMLEMNSMKSVQEMEDARAFVVHIEEP